MRVSTFPYINGLWILILVTEDKKCLLCHQALPRSEEQEDAAFQHELSAALGRPVAKSIPWTERNASAYFTYLRASEVKESDSPERRIQSLWYELTLESWFKRAGVPPDKVDLFFNLGIWDGVPTLL